MLGDGMLPSPSLSQYERLDDPHMPVHKFVHYGGGEQWRRQQSVNSCPPSRGSRSNYRSATALVQAWDQFVVSIKYASGIVAWESKRLASRKKFEVHPKVGARSRVHRISHEAGLPCFVWNNCPQCLPGADSAPAPAYTGEDWE
jgi:hypothetical protein